MPMNRCSPPETFSIGRFESPIGGMLIVHDGKARLRVLDFADCEPRMRRLLRLHYGQEGSDFVLKDGRAPKIVANSLAAYFAGALTAVDRISIATAGSLFQRKVWAALRQIPPGTTLSYGGLAQKIGCPKSVRAVGLANGANPIAIVVPCHRVIGADASLTGYGGGLDRKRWLLLHEGAVLKVSVARRVPDVA
jgi:methylated-DNA-[protein]-cysteine S-methyltransferase